MRPRLFHATNRFELTPRQEEVIRLIARGKTNAEIADVLGISLDGAKYHVREILGKLGADSREEACALWRESERPLARAGRWAGGLASLGVWRTGAVALGCIAAGAAGLVVLLAIGGDGGGPAALDPTAAPTFPSTPAGSESRETATPPAAAMPSGACGALPLTITPARTTFGTVRFEISAVEPAAPCRYDADIRFEVLDDALEPLDVRTNGLTAGIRAELPLGEPLSEIEWQNWCGPVTPVTVRASALGVEATIQVDPPDCAGESLGSGLTLLVTHVARPPDPTPPPFGLARLEWPLDGDAVPVWLYADAEDTTEASACIEIVADIVPAAAAGGGTAAKPGSCGGDLSRIRFATDTSGRNYVLGVELLLPGLATLPQPNFGNGYCGSILEHLVPATLPLEDAAYILVCDAQPLPRGVRTPLGPIAIHAYIASDYAPATLPPPETPCWELSRYLGSAGEGAVTNVVCTLE